MTKDPIGFRGGINQYSYVLNNSVNARDPKGLYTWSGAGVDVGGFLFNAGRSTLSGSVTNWDTGEKCSIQAICYKLGVGLGGGVTATSIWTFNGPKCGKDIKGKSVSMNLEGGIGFKYFNPSGGVSFSDDGSTGESFGVGYGLGLAGYAAVCTTTVLTCENTPCECK